MTGVNIALVIFILTTTVCVVALSIYAIKLLICFTQLTTNINVIATSVQKEIEPTLKELRETAKSINSITAGADTQIQVAKARFDSILGATSSVGEKLKGFMQGIMKGVAFGLNLINKRKG